MAGEVVARIVYEPTGAYHKGFERLMLSQGIALSKVNPRLARRFGEATGKLTKTDRAEAEMLAFYGQLLSPRLLRQTTAALNDLKELHAARLALIKDRTAASNRGKNLTQPLLKRQNAARLKQIEDQLAQVDKTIMALIEADEPLKARFDIIVSSSPFPGFQPSRLSRCSSRCRNLASWRTRPQQPSPAWRRGIGSPDDGPTGRAFVVAIRFSPDLKAKYDALIKAGKPSKVAITAIMRKLVVLANTLLRQNRKWQPKNA